MPRNLLAGLVFLLIFVLPGRAAAQDVEGTEVGEELLREVMPEAERFGPKEGRPPVITAFATDPATGAEQAIGYLFFTADVPPERKGYSGPVRALVGMDVAGVVTGVRVLSYYESYRSQMGDFLRRDGHQEQYAGKSIADKFLVRDDIDGISRATVSSRALAQGVRDATRRVARAYFERAPAPEGPIQPWTLSWLELMDREVARPVIVHEGEEVLAEIALMHIDSPETGAHLVGAPAWGMIERAIESRGREGYAMAYGVYGAQTGVFSRQGWSATQGGHSYPIPENNVFPFGLAGGGLLRDELTTIGAMLLPSELDLAQPFTVDLDLGGEREVTPVEYATLLARGGTIVMAEAGAPAAGGGEPGTSAATVAAGSGDPGSDDPGASARGSAAPGSAARGSAGPGTAAAGPDSAGATDRGAASDPAAPDAPTAGEPAAADPTSRDPTSGDPSPGGAEAGDPAASVSGTAAADPTVGPGPASASAPATQDFDFLDDEEEAESWSASMLAGLNGPRTVAMLGLLALTTIAFLKKRPALRWATLVITLGYLGFADGGFLSVSHITSAIWVGGSAFLNDVPLLLIAGFTLLATLLFGRVFCGFLCPFGALQDLLTRFVPRRFQRRVPERLHRAGLKVKYVVLAVILVPALLGSHASLYPYFEPFGTVFFRSPSVLLWAIALAFIAASAVVPRFYCRYACPLGAALAIGSLVSINRIRRVEHCTLCKVCENACPTGAIRGAEIDFKECVRCNACETLLIEKAGVCGHDLEAIRPRLVQIQRSGAST
ncbi:4Fe-4S binding protein [Gaopeijia maritima]|uniref:NosR/NirI family protein n=1 Tax=Gaopeijia maritima TaxID=3119007 RepID=UPI003251949C